MIIKYFVYSSSSTQTNLPLTFFDFFCINMYGYIYTCTEYFRPRQLPFLFFFLFLFWLPTSLYISVVLFLTNQIYSLGFLSHVTVDMPPFISQLYSPHVSLHITPLPLSSLFALVRIRTSCFFLFSSLDILAELRIIAVKFFRVFE